MQEKKEKKLKSVVPAQAGGYYLQETRFFYHLLKAKKGTIVSLEYVSDVSIKTADGNVVAEEDKSSIKGNPVTDKSVGLWKTFNNWLNAVRDGILKLDSTEFRLYVPKRCTGNLIEKFSKAITDLDAQKAFVEAKRKLWGNDSNVVSKTLKPYLENIFTSPEKMVYGIITKFRFETGENGIYKEIDEILENMAIPIEIIDDVRQHLLGWVKEKIDKTISQGIPPFIRRNDFLEELRIYTRRANRNNLLVTYASMPTDDEKQKEMKQPKVYLKQLELIEADFDIKLAAISDFLMASVDRAQWAERGIVHEKSLDELEDNLFRTWKNRKQQIEILQRERTEIEKGQLLLLDCSSHKAELEGNPVPNHYVPGSFHALSDDKKIGWHPNWTHLLSDVKKIGDGDV